MTTSTPPHSDGNDRYSFCPKCGGALGRAQQAGRERLVCPACGFVFYQNPNVGVAAVVIEHGAVLLTLRGGSVRPGQWELPGGYVEFDEDIRDALTREMLEETGLVIEVGRVLGVRSNFFRDPDSHSVGVWFTARRVAGDLAAGDDAIEARFFPLHALPADEEIAFENDRAILALLRETGGDVTSLA